jgi:hypothetical protein
MATVKFSQELRDRIVAAANSKFQQDVIRANDSHPKDWGDRLYDVLFANIEAKLTDVPAYWFAKQDNIRIHSIGSTPVSLSYTLKPTRIWPACMPEKYVGELLCHKRSSYSDDLILKDVEAFAEFKAEVVAWRNRVQAAQKRQQEFAESVKKVINAYVTLAPALKAWPPLWDLIPDDVKEKHKKIVERERKEVDLDVDLDRMTALASFSKIRGGE